MIFAGVWGLIELILVGVIAAWLYREDDATVP
jgi:hypothetical protein